MAIDLSTPRSRRAVLLAAIGGAAAAAATVARPLQALAATDSVSYLNDETNANVLQAQSSLGGIGVRGLSNTFVGVMGLSETDAGVQGQGRVGVRAVGTDVGIRGESEDRGGLLSGRKAQLRLQPASARTHPASGAAGDLFVDKRKRLWFCRGGSDWVRVA